jgi:peptidyl-prolyl cis-trans isomerase C
VLAVASIAGVACTPAERPEIIDENVVAVFDGGTITRSELLEAGRRSRSANAPGKAGASTDDDWRLTTIRDLAFRTALANEAPDTPLIDRTIEEQHRAALVGFMEDHLGWNSLTVSEAEVRHQYDSHPEQYRDPEKARVQHIFLRAEAGKTTARERQAVRERLEGIRRQLLAGADFTAMAREHSQSATAKRGGWLGINRNEAVDPAFIAAAWSTPVNGISEIIDTPRGFHVLTVRERHPAFVREYEAVRKYASKRALADKRADLQRQFLAEAGDRFGLERNYEALLDPEVPFDAVLISAGSFKLTVSDLTRQIEPRYVEHLYNRYLPKVRELLDRIALDQLLVLEAGRLGLDESPEFAATAKAIDRDVRYQAALDARLAAKGRAVPDAEIREYYEQNQERYMTARRTDLSLIYLPRSDNLWKDFEKAEDLVRQIRAGASFEDLARAHSTHYSVRDGGQMRGLTDPDLASTVQSGAKFRRALKSLEDGEVADPLIAECYDTDTLRFMQTGVIIVRKDHVREPELRPYDEAEPLVRANYVRRHYSTLVAEVRSEVLHDIDLKILEDRLPGA